jgi:hypothetical protein
LVRRESVKLQYQKTQWNPKRKRRCCMQGDLSTRNRTQKLKKAQPTQNISRRIEDRKSVQQKKQKNWNNKQISSIGTKKKTAKFRGSRSWNSSAVIHRRQERLQ